LDSPRCSAAAAGQRIRRRRRRPVPTTAAATAGPRADRASGVAAATGEAAPREVTGASHSQRNPLGIPMMSGMAASELHSTGGGGHDRRGWPEYRG